MNDNLIQSIIDFSKGTGNKEAAVAAHRLLLRRDWEAYRMTDAYGFMHEMEHPLPDPFLKAMYRERLSR